MKIKRVVVFIVVLTAMAIQAGVKLAEAGLNKIAENVYAYTGVQEGSPGNAFSANAGIVVGKEAVLVVDTLTSAKEALKFLEDIRVITDKPIRYVVNTHYHLDHALGNCVFAQNEEARIIGHEKCRQAIEESAENIIQNPDIFGMPADFWAGTSIVAPDIFFKQEMSVDLGGLTVEFIYSGYASHSPGSIFVSVPERSVVFTGDILFTDFHPYLGEGDFPGWDKTLDRVIAMKAKYLIPGHGPLSTTENLYEMKSYLEIFDKKARELSAAESDPAKLSEALLKVIPHRSSGAFLVNMNVKSRYLKKAEKNSVQEKE